MIYRLVITLLLLTPFCQLSAQINFEKSSFQDAVAEANAQNKLIYVFANSSWCISCDQMESTVLFDSLVGTYLNSSFVSLKQNIEDEFGIKFAMKYRLTNTPAHLFFDKHGQLIRRGDGIMDLASFLKLAKLASDSASAYKPLDDPLSFELGFPQWYIDYRKPPEERVFPTQTQIKTFLESRDSITDEVSWAIIYTLPTPEEYTGKIIESKTELSERYGRNEVLEKLSSFVYQDVKRAIKSNSESLLYEAMRKANRLLGEDAPAYKLRYQLYYYQLTGNWNIYADLGLELALNPTLSDSNWLNDIAINLYKNTTDTTALAKAANWMEMVSEKQPTYSHLSTAATIQFRLNNTQKAIELAQKAIEVGNTSNADTSEMKNLIARISE